MARPYEYAVSITSQFYFCGVPFRLDASPRCAHGCMYCFRTARGGNVAPLSTLASPSRIGKKLARAGTGVKMLDVAEELLHHRVPLHCGGLSDPFSDENTSRVSLELLGHIADSQYPVVISTKNPARLLLDDAAEIVRRIPSLAVQVSFTSHDSTISSNLEPDAPPPVERLNAAAALAGAGVYTIARIQPLFPSLADTLAKELVPRLASVGFRHVLVECLKLPVEKAGQALLMQVPELRADLQLLLQERMLVGREWLLPTTARWRLIRPVVESIRQNGMTYGAADYGLYHLGDTDTCCGVSHLPGFQNWFQANITYAIRRANLNDRVEFSVISDRWAPSGSVSRFMNSHSRSPQTTTVLDYIRRKWNRPGTTNAPDAYLGVVCTGERDCQGDLIYFRHANDE